MPFPNHMMDKLIIAVILCTGTVFSEQNSTCTQALQELLANLSTKFNNSDNSLALQGQQRPDIVEVCSTRNFSVELWRAIKSPNAKIPEDFGTREYFSKFQNCDSPNPDLLWKHGHSSRASVDPLSLNLSDSWLKQEIKFYHVVEKQYMVRICPCKDHKLPCTCEHAEQSEAVCSEVLNISNPGEDQVFPWCKGDVMSSPTPLIGVPGFQHCPSKVMLTGTLPSCTPVQDYDQVEVVLQPMFHEVGDCKELPRDGVGMLRRQVPLKPVNTTHGMFEVVIGNITHDTQYCFKVELVNHPYCNSGSDHTLTRLSPVCRPISLQKPILIEDQVCGRPEPCQSQPNLPLITGASLVTALLLTLIVVLLHRIGCRQSSRRMEQAGVERLLLPPPSPLHPDIFFLYWGDSTDFIEVNRLVVRWLVDLGHRVIDLSDEVLQEELISSPESWIISKLEDSNTKVIVVESEIVNEYLKLDCENFPKAGVEFIKIFSLRHIQAHLSCNYRRLSVVQYKGGLRGPVSSLVPHTRYTLPEHLAELHAWLAETQGWDDNGNLESAREQTLRDLKAAVQRYTAARQ